MDHDIVITSAIRTPIGCFGGNLSSLTGDQLGSHLIAHMLDITRLDPTTISEVILGQVLNAGQGQNPARQAAIHGGVAPTVPAFTIQQVCGSGMQAIIDGCLRIQTGMSEIVIAGGQESMSNAPYAIRRTVPTALGDQTAIDTLTKDGLTDAFHNISMGVTAENIAATYAISRKEQDAFAFASHQKAQITQQNGNFEQEIIPLNISDKNKTTLVALDSHLRPDSTLDSLSQLKPVFKKNGTVTAGNASGINDGAAIVLLMTRQKAATLGFPPLASIKAYAHAAVDPKVMGTGPIPASKQALSLAGWTVDDLDIVESNEAFAAQAIAVNQVMGWDPDIVNIGGGAIALGHPIGASGARIVVTLLHHLQRLQKNKGLATLCVGGGMGVALAIAREG